MYVENFCVMVVALSVTLKLLLGSSLVAQW